MNDIQARKLKHEKVFAVITVLVSTLLCLVIAEFILRWQQQRIDSSSSGDPGLLRYHQRLGWELTPRWTGRHRHYDFDVHYSINRHGFRGDFPDAPGDKRKFRIGVLGDSFSFGLGVNDDETFVHYLNQQDGERDYLNLSIPGYSTDQQLLLLKSVRSTIRVDAYLLVIYLGNDILDNALSYPLQLDQAKPFFELDESGQLVLQNVPVPAQQKPAALRSLSLGSILFGDALQEYKPYSPLRRLQLWKRLVPQTGSVDRERVDSLLDERLARQKNLLHALLRDVHNYTSDHGASLELALLPGRSYILAPDTYSAWFQEYVRASIKTMAAGLAIPTRDLAGQMRDLELAKSSWYHPNEGHLTAEGHKMIAELLLRQPF